MTKVPQLKGMSEIEHGTWQNVMLVADRRAAAVIRRYGENHRVEALEDMQEPYDPSLEPEESFAAEPALQKIVEQAASNPANRPFFGIKRSDIVAATVQNASAEVRGTLSTQQWANLVKASAHASCRPKATTWHQQSIT